jgi:hypothetical protein
VEKPSVSVLQILGVVIEDKSIVIHEQEFTRLHNVQIVLNGRLVYAMEDVARDLGS